MKVSLLTSAPTRFMEREPPFAFAHASGDLEPRSAEFIPLPVASRRDGGMNSALRARSVHGERGAAPSCRSDRSSEGNVERLSKKTLPIARKGFRGSKSDQNL